MTRCPPVPHWHWPHWPKDRAYWLVLHVLWWERRPP